MYSWTPYAQTSGNCGAIRKSIGFSNRWLQAERQEFWEEQCELIEGHQSFRIRMAVPGSDADQLRVVVSMDGIEIRDLGHLIRRMKLSAPVDASSITAMLDRGELHLSGATSQAQRKKRK